MNGIISKFGGKALAFWGIWLATPKLNGVQDESDNNYTDIDIFNMLNQILIDLQIMVQLYKYRCNFTNTSIYTNNGKSK